MKTIAWFGLLAATALAGCASSAAPDFGGRWQPVNRFASAPQEIPLHAAYRYRATPLDRTLKTLLERWAADSGLQLDYRLASDFTLHLAVAGIDSTDLQQALAELGSAYAGQGVALAMAGGTISAGRAAPAAAAAKSLSAGQAGE